MEKQSKLTPLGLIVVILVILFLLLLTMPVLSNLHKLSWRSVCKRQLKGLGQAMMLYSNDYDGNYPQLPGQGPWAKELGFSYDLNHPDFEADQSNTPRTITASLYLLTREADVSPKSFVCTRTRRSEQLEEFDGSNPKNLDIVDLWDFGEKPHDHVSYAYHNPYGKYPTNKNRSSSFAVAADMNPWFQNGDIVQPGSNGQPPQLLTQYGWKSKKQAMNSNSPNHDWKGQNILYTDGHVSFETSSNAGVKHDNIYTFWSVEEEPSEQDIQGGTAPTGRSAENDAKSEGDSFLAI